MPLPTLAAVGDLEVRLGVAVGSLAGADLARAQAALADASTLVRAESGRAWVDADAQPVAPPGVVVVVLQAAQRCYRNPDGLAGESVGPYSWQGDQKALSIYLTDTEKETIADAVRAAAAALGGWTGTGSIATPTPWQQCWPAVDSWDWSP